VGTLGPPYTSLPLPAAGEESIYAARISLNRKLMQIEKKTVSLAPGMAVTVEIKPSQRRVIEYLLSPLLRYRHEAARERGSNLCDHLRH
jgi:hemolysin D